MEGRIDHAGSSSRDAENELKMRQADLRTQEQQVQTQQMRMQQESATLDSARYDLSKVRIESPIDGIVTRRNIEEGETVVIGTMNNAGTVLLTIADMSVIEAEVEVDETDIPTRAARTDGEGHDRRDAWQDVHGEGDRNRQQPDSDGRSAAAASQATNFKVVLTIDGEIPEVRPGLHMHGGNHDGDARKRRVRADPGARPSVRCGRTRRARSSASTQAERTGRPRASGAVQARN